MLYKKIIDVVKNNNSRRVLDLYCGVGSIGICVSDYVDEVFGVEVVEKAINDVTLQKENIISSDYILDIVSNYFKIDKRDLISAKKSNDIAYPRQIAMYLCRTVGQMSFPRIGNDFGGRDHTTVMHAYKKIEKEIKEKTNTKLIVESVKSIITNKN